MRTITITLYAIFELSPHAREVAYTNYRREWHAKRASEQDWPIMSQGKFEDCCRMNGDEFTECGTRY